MARLFALQRRTTPTAFRYCILEWRAFEASTSARSLTDQRWYSGSAGPVKRGPEMKRLSLWELEIDDVLQNGVLNHSAIILEVILTVCS
jgi:hypothetical protein